MVEIEEANDAAPVPSSDDPKGVQGGKEQEAAQEPGEASSAESPLEEAPKKLQFNEGMPTEDWEKSEDVGEGVRKLLLTPAKEGASNPVLGATVFAHYKAWVQSTGSKVFDTWDEKTQVELTLGSVRKDLQGLAHSILSMKQGEKSLFLVPSKLAYGTKGNFSFPSVPPNADLIYEVQLNGFDNPSEGRQRANLTVEDKIESADKRRQAGNEHFKNSRFQEALMEYEMALGYMGEEFMMQMFGKYRDMANAVRLPCLLNSAACNLKLGNFHEAVNLCSGVLAEEKTNVKALFRRGKAKMSLGHMEDAKEDLLEAQKLAPDDSAIKQALIEIRKDERERREKEKALFKGVLDKAKEKEKLKEKERVKDGGGEDDRGEEERLLKGETSLSSSASGPPSKKRAPWWKAVWAWLKNCVWHFVNLISRRKMD